QGVKDIAFFANMDANFTLTGNGSGTFVDKKTQAPLNFQDFENLRGGTGNDLFLLANASARVTGQIDGGAGLDIFDIGGVDAPFNITGSSGGSFTGSVNGINFTNIESRGSLGFGVLSSTGQVLQTLFDLAGMPIMSSAHVT